MEKSNNNQKDNLLNKSEPYDLRYSDFNNSYNQYQGSEINIKFIKSKPLNRKKTKVTFLKSDGYEEIDKIIKKSKFYETILMIIIVLCFLIAFFINVILAVIIGTISLYFFRNINPKIYLGIGGDPRWVGGGYLTYLFMGEKIAKKLGTEEKSFIMTNIANSIPKDFYFKRSEIEEDQENFIIEGTKFNKKEIYRWPIEYPPNEHKKKNYPTIWQPFITEKLNKGQAMLLENIKLCRNSEFKLYDDPPLINLVYALGALRSPDETEIDKENIDEFMKTMYRNVFNSASNTSGKNILYSPMIGGGFCLIRLFLEKKVPKDIQENFVSLMRTKITKIVKDLIDEGTSFDEVVLCGGYWDESVF